jgi:hypothetical protein
MQALAQHLLIVRWDDLVEESPDKYAVRAVTLPQYIYIYIHVLAISNASMCQKSDGGFCRPSRKPSIMLIQLKPLTMVASFSAVALMIAKCRRIHLGDSVRKCNAVKLVDKEKLGVIIWPRLMLQAVRWDNLVEVPCRIYADDGVRSAPVDCRKSLARWFREGHDRGLGLSI